MAVIGELSPELLETYAPMIPRRFFTASEDGAVRFFGIKNGTEPAGVVVVQTRADLAQLRFLYIEKSLRGTGVMAELLTELMLDLRKDGTCELFCNYVPAAMPRLDQLLIRSTFSFHDTGHAYFRFPAKSLKRNVLPANKELEKRLIPLDKLPADLRSRMSGRIKGSGYLVDVNTLPPEDTKGSMVYMEGENPRGMLLLLRMDDLAEPDREVIDLGLFYISSEHTSVTLTLLRSLVDSIASIPDQEQMITGYFPDAAPVALLERVLGVRAQRERVASMRLTNLDMYRKDVPPDF